jgi:hypothetical protein
MHVSLDTWGAPAEYIRFGLDCNIWEENFKTILHDFTNVDASIEIMITYNNLAVASFRSLLEKILDWRKEFSKNHQRVDFCTPHLKEPAHWTINILPESFQKYLEEDIKFMKSNVTGNYTGFTEVEVEKLERVLSSMRQYKLPSDELSNAKSDFAAFFMEHDKRRETNFNEVFPEYIEFINECKKI